MLNKLEILNHSSYGYLNQLDKQNSTCTRFGIHGISTYANNILYFGDDIRTNVYITIDSLRPKQMIESYISIVNSLHKYSESIYGYNIPIDFNHPVNLIHLKELIDCCMWSGKIPRLGIDLSQILDEQELKRVIEKIEHIGINHVFLYYSDKKIYDVYDQIIFANWVIKYTGLFISLFGKYNKEYLSMPILTHPRIKSIGTGPRNIYDILLNSTK